MENYSLIPCTQVLSRLSEELSSYSVNNLLDTGKLFPRIRLFIEQIGIGGYEMTESVVLVENYKAELPCDFFMLDSAWLCDTKNSFTESAFQGQFQIYNTKTCETVCVDSCNYSCQYGLTATCAQNETVLEKVTITETIESSPKTITWQHPVLLSLGNKVTQNVCSKGCANIFSKCPENISIRKQGEFSYLYSNLKDATIYLKYYSYPLDENQLPMIYDSPIFEEALFYDLMLYTIKHRWYNNEIVDVENKIKLLTQDRDQAYGKAVALSKMPSFRKMIEICHRRRNLTMNYEIAYQPRETVRYK